MEEDNKDGSNEDLHVQRIVGWDISVRKTNIKTREEEIVEGITSTCSCVEKRWTCTKRGLEGNTFGWQWVKSTLAWRKKVFLKNRTHSIPLLEKYFFCFTETGWVLLCPSEGRCIRENIKCDLQAGMRPKEVWDPHEGSLPPSFINMAY